MNQVAHREKHSEKREKLHVGFELSKKKWKLAFGDGSARPARLVTIEARNFERLYEEISKARRRFGMSEIALIVSCYEAGRDGFWIHRALEGMGIRNIVVDPSSMEVNRRRRRAKTDRMDAEKLLRSLIRHENGERVWSVVRIPSVADEDIRHLHREREALKKERTSHRTRIRSLLFIHGIDVRHWKELKKNLTNYRQWDGQVLSDFLVGRLEREICRLEEVEKQLKEIEEQRQKILEGPQESEKIQKIQKLSGLKGVGMQTAWTLVMEHLGWRIFKNRRELGSSIGLTPTPWSSGNLSFEQGISKAGNKRIRVLINELAWNWIRYQPESELSQWFVRRFAAGGKRQRCIGITAVARKLLIALWRYIEEGTIPTGALLKTA